MKPEDADEKISNALEGLRPHRLDAYTLKTKSLKFRLHDAEFEEIRETAESLGLSIAEYFCTLHRFAAKHLAVPPDGGEWVHPDSTARRKRRNPRDK